MDQAESFSRLIFLDISLKLLGLILPLLVRFFPRFSSGGVTTGLLLEPLVLCGVFVVFFFFCGVFFFFFFFCFFFLFWVFFFFFFFFVCFFFFLVVFFVCFFLVVLLFLCFCFFCAPRGTFSLLCGLRETGTTASPNRSPSICSPTPSFVFTRLPMRSRNAVGALSAKGSPIGLYFFLRSRMQELAASDLIDFMPGDGPLRS